MTAPDTPLWLFADQLGPRLYGGEHAHRPILLIEAASALRRRRFHRQKLHLVASALRHAERDLGERATLLRADTYLDGLRAYGRPQLKPASGAGQAGASLSVASVEPTATTARLEKTRARRGPSMAATRRDDQEGR